MRLIPWGRSALGHAAGVAVVRLRGRRCVFADRTRRAAAIGRRRRVLRRSGGARPADLPGPMRGLSRQCDGRHQRTAAGRREFPLELERASAGGSRRQDSEDDALQPAREPVPAAINRPRGLHSPGRQVSRRTSRTDRRRRCRRLRSPRRATPPRPPPHRRGRVDSAAARRKPCRADESDRVSQFEHHLQPSAQGSRRPAEKGAGLLAVRLRRVGIHGVSADGWLSIRPPWRSPRPRRSS